MAPTPLLTLKDIYLTFGGTPLFEGVSMVVGRGERACLVGRNGSGKSTLLKILAGIMEPDGGERAVTPGAKVAYLPQDPPLEPGRSVAQYVEKGLGGSGDHHRIDWMLQHLKLEGHRDLGELSGGEGRRAALARALIGEPDLLLLDEPTNHLDLPTILWMEEELSRFPGAIVTISHDRTFLTKLTRKTFWLDRGEIRQREEGFASFERWSDEIAEADEAELGRTKTKLKAENRWRERGVTARRKRNMGRMRGLFALREHRAKLLARRQTNAKITLDAGERSGKTVVEAEDLQKSFGETLIVDGFSTRIQRGDRVGLIGPNGAGKTTLLKILTGELAPDGGTIKLGTNLTPAYFDQRRASLDPDATLWETLCELGGDQVEVQGRHRHVVSYLKDFLFEEVQARSAVKTLSGGERNRLLLAKLFAQPSNLLILDEPTNDLDIETLDLLQELLSDYAGTLLLVSHDRDFLDRLVTSVIAVEGDGHVDEFAGGYEDYARFRKANPIGGPVVPAKAAKPKQAPAAKRQTKLSYKDQRELDNLPTTLDKLRIEIAGLETTLADPNLFAKKPGAYQVASTRLQAAQDELADGEDRWLELEMKREELGANFT